MKTILKSGLVAVLLAASATASADWSANLGFASEYYYRGIFQSSSSASGGLDFESGGFYAGTWAADVGDGLEVDLYGGYGGEVVARIAASEAYSFAMEDSFVYRRFRSFRQAAR